MNHTANIGISKCISVDISSEFISVRFESITLRIKKKKLIIEPNVSQFILLNQNLTIKPENQSKRYGVGLFRFAGFQIFSLTKK